MKVHGGSFQYVTAYSRQACAGPSTWSACVDGGFNDQTGINVCHNTVNGDGGSNALSSFQLIEVCLF